MGGLRDRGLNDEQLSVGEPLNFWFQFKGFEFQLIQMIQQYFYWSTNFSYLLLKGILWDITHFCVLLAAVLLFQIRPISPFNSP